MPGACPIRQPSRQVVTAPCDQPHAITVALQAEAVAVVLDLVEPVRRVRNLGSPRRDAEIERVLML